MPYALKRPQPILWHCDAIDSAWFLSSLENALVFLFAVSNPTKVCPRVLNIIAFGSIRQSKFQHSQWDVWWPWSRLNQSYPYALKHQSCPSYHGGRSFAMHQPFRPSVETADEHASFADWLWRAVLIMASCLRHRSLCSRAAAGVVRASDRGSSRLGSGEFVSWMNRREFVTWTGGVCILDRESLWLGLGEFVSLIGRVCILGRGNLHLRPGEFVSRTGEVCILDRKDFVSRTGKFVFLTGELVSWAGASSDLGSERVFVSDRARTSVSDRGDFASRTGERSSHRVRYS